MHRKVHADAVAGKELSCVHCEPDDQIISQPSLTKAISEAWRRNITFS